LRYLGLDGVERRTCLSFFPAPVRITPNRATINISLAPQQYASLFVTVSCGEGKAVPIRGFFISYRDADRARRAATVHTARLESSHGSFRDVASRAVSDVYTLVTRTEHGSYPYAGIPWFSTIFGRDGIITAMLMLWMDPAIAKGVLRTLAAMQAVVIDPKSDAQPGKILHECRHGEMANLGEVPFQRYYGSIDSTPLFLMLAGMYAERTGDLKTITEIWPNIVLALRWIDEFGDRDSDGFVEYHRETESGLANQGWKDSWDAIFHADGSLASGAIALCEVQGYVFAAKRAVARLAEQLGDADLAVTLTEEAGQLQQRFEQDFWCDEIGTYALALDGEKRACRVRTSNAGHALFTGIAAPDRARRVAASLMRPESFGGWGIRTLSHGEPRYNPMSYHNGSVWPHDNALIALGLSRYGLRSQAARVFTGLFQAATYHELHRLPELYCGFNRRPHRGPTAYPVACSPQAWSAAALPGLLAAILGLDLSHQDDTIRFRDPWLPDVVDELAIRNLRLGESCVDLHFHRVAQDVAVRLLARDGTAKVIVLK
jgi:glycogen debranching enzyme